MSNLSIISKGTSLEVLLTNFLPVVAVVFELSLDLFNWVEVGVGKGLWSCGCNWRWSSNASGAENGLESELFNWLFDDWLEWTIY